MKKKVIINDFIINESKCNFSCEYCLSNDLSDGKKEYINSASGVGKGEIDVIENAIKVLDIHESFIDADVLQLSGGEIFLNDGILRLVLEKSKKYKYIYILTNGYLINEHIAEALSSAGNVVVGFSLDGHTLGMNHYRFKDDKVLEVIINNMEIVYKKHIPIIVNSVIHDRNINVYHEFLTYLADVFPGVGVFPIAVRGESSEMFKPSIEDLSVLMDITNDGDLYKHLRALPIYFEELYKVMAGISHTKRCKVPYLTTELFDSGAMFPCPLFWVSEIGNIVSESPDDVFKKVGVHKIYPVLTKHCGSIPFCRNCFSSYSLFNLYVEDAINETQLKTIPFLDYEQIGTHIRDITKNTENLVIMND